MSLIRVKAFGLNRSELHTCLGLAQGVTFPRVLGTETVGVVALCPGKEFPAGQQIVAMIGGIGRVFDGGYAEYTCVPATQVIAFHSDLNWDTLGAVPEMLQTSYGSLTVGLDAQPGQSILIRGGTSSVGMATAVLAQQRNMTVLSTKRNPDKTAALTTIGVDHVLNRRRRGGQAGARDPPQGRRLRTRTRRYTHAARHAASDAGRRGCVLHRDAVQPVDGPRLLPDRLHPARRPPHRIRRRCQRSPSKGAARLPGRSRRRRRGGAHRSCLPHRSEGSG